MVCKSEEFFGLNIPNWQSQNWNGEVTFTAEQYWVPTHSADGEVRDGLLQLVNVVARATEEQKHLTAIGSGWAFEDNAKSDDLAVSLSRLNRRLNNVVGDALTDEWQKSQKRTATVYRPLVHVEAGIEIGALNKMLAIESLALRTLGGSNGQSLAGAISTSTHGGDWRERPLADWVRAIHLVTEGGRELWIERASERITDDDRLKQAMTCKDSSTEIVRDDAIFNSALVACGRFGVIYSLVLEVRDAFRVIEVTTKPTVMGTTTTVTPGGVVTFGPPENLLLRALRDGIGIGDLYRPLFDLLKKDPLPADLAEAKSADGGPSPLSLQDPSYFELLFNSLSPNNCWVRRRWETTNADDLEIDSQKTPLTGGELVGIAEAALTLAGATAMAIFPFPVGQIFATAIALTGTEIAVDTFTNRLTPGNAAAHILNAMWKLPWVGDATKDIENYFLNDRFKKSMVTGRRGPHHIVTSGTQEDSQSTDFRSNSIELVFDAGKTGYLDFLDTALAESPRYKQAGYITLRFSRSSQGTMSMHNVISGFLSSGFAVSIECASIQGLQDNRAWIQFLERIAIENGGRPHWGQNNNLNDGQVTALYGPNLVEWREALLRVSGESTLFSSHFTRQRGLEPTNIPRWVTAVHRTTHGVVTHLCGPAGATWSPVGVAEAIRQIKSGVAVYFTRAGNEIALVEVVGDEYLRTRSDTTVENNLDNLPECQV